MPASDTFPARFMDLRERSSDWKMRCPTHGLVNNVVVFNEDIANRTYCQDCFEVEMAKLSKRTTLELNGGPAPTAARST